MSKCYACQKQLIGSWNMTSCNGYEQTGRYLGISDGYFLYGENPNWVYCYCQSCWKDNILKLSFVQERIKNQQHEKVKLDKEELFGPPHEIELVQKFQQQLVELNNQLNELKQQNEQYKFQIEVMQEMKVNLNFFNRLKQICDEIQVDTALQIKNKNLLGVGVEINKILSLYFPPFKEDINNLLNQIIEGGSQQIQELNILENNIVSSYKKCKFQFGQEEINSSLGLILKKKQEIEKQANKWTELLGKLIVMK